MLGKTIPWPVEWYKPTRWLRRKKIACKWGSWINPKYTFPGRSNTFRWRKSSCTRAASGQRRDSQQVSKCCSFFPTKGTANLQSCTQCQQETKNQLSHPKETWSPCYGSIHPACPGTSDQLRVPKSLLMQQWWTRHKFAWWRTWDGVEQ